MGESAVTAAGAAATTANRASRELADVAVWVDRLAAAGNCPPRTVSALRGAARELRALHRGLAVEDACGRLARVARVLHEAALTNGYDRVTQRLAGRVEAVKAVFVGPDPVTGRARSEAVADRTAAREVEQVRAGA